MRNEECGMQNAECGMKKVEGGRQKFNVRGFRFLIWARDHAHLTPAPRHHEPEHPLTRPSGTLSHTGGEGWG